MDPAGRELDCRVAEAWNDDSDYAGAASEMPGNGTDIDIMVNDCSSMND